MDTAKEYIENIQGLLLFMHLKRNQIISLQDLAELDKIVREDLIEEFKKNEKEILDWFDTRTNHILNDMQEYQVEQIQENRKHLSPDEIQEEIKEVEEYIQLLRNTPTPSKFQDKIAYNIVESIFKEVAKAAESLGVKKVPLVMLATLYTERVNASAMRMKKTGEYIIAFESQLFSFLNRFTKIIVQALPEKESTNPDIFAFSFLESEVKKHIEDSPTLKILFTDLVLSYIINGNVSQAQNFALDNGRYINATYILRATELFIMGHEYGHIVKGHLQPKLGSAIEVANLSVDEIERNWNQEYEADALGLFFMIKVLHDEGFMEDFKLIGADLYFILNEITDKAWSIKRFGHENGSGISGSHPPAKLRRENLRKAFRMSYTEEQLQMAEILPNALEGILYHLWNEIKPLLYQYYDINKDK